MQREDDRDRAIDRALRQTIHASMSAAEAHIDGETLAAWAEGQLRPDAAARVETHASSCAQCQQMLAAFARTAPPPTVTEPLWRRWHLQWLVPIATAATVAAIWIAIPRPERARAIAPLAEQAPVATPQPTPPNAAAEPPREEASTRAQAKPNALAESAPQKASPRTLAKSTALAPDAKREELERRDARDQFATRQADAAPPAPSAPVAGQAGARERESDTPQSLQETIAVARPAAPPAAPAAAAPPAPATAPTPPGANTATAAGAAATGAARRGVLGDSQLLAARAFATPLEIRSPNTAIRWRIVDAGRKIERTINSGAEWQAATLSPIGVVVSGMSPAPSVCWIVGRAGAIYVTTDGLRFVRVMFPESIDLVSVTATDDRHATVMSADGRSFRTDDGGVTWSR